LCLKVYNTAVSSHLTANRKVQSWVKLKNEAVTSFSRNCNRVKQHHISNTSLWGNSKDSTFK